MWNRFESGGCVENGCCDKSNNNNKPPLGLLPKETHDKFRLESITSAIKRYRRAGKKVPYEWYEEAFDLNVELNAK